MKKLLLAFTLIGFAACSSQNTSPPLREQLLIVEAKQDQELDSMLEETKINDIESTDKKFELKGSLVLKSNHPENNYDLLEVDSTGKEEVLKTLEISGRSEPAYERGALYFLANTDPDGEGFVKNSLFTLNLNSGLTEMIPIPISQDMEVAGIAAFLVTEKTIFYLEGSCAESYPCQLFEYDRTTGKTQFITNNLPNHIFQGLSFKDYNSEDRTLIIRQIEGDGGYAALSFYSFNLDSKTLSEPQVFSNWGECDSYQDDPLYACNSEQIRKNEEYNKAKAEDWTNGCKNNLILEKYKPENFWDPEFIIVYCPPIF